MTVFLITDLVVKVAYAICVTVAAISFDKLGILWWYVLLLFLGGSYRSQEEK